MKKINLILVVIFSISFTLNAQLSNSSWKTTLYLDQPVNTVFTFNNDTLSVKNIDDNSNLETMKFTLKDTTLTIQKLSGQSECDTSVVGTYSCKISGNAMAVKLITDNCDHRAAIIKDIKLEKVE